MSHKITIKNLGPIKDIKNLEVRRVNAVIGESASGKSLLAKAICAFNEPDIANALCRGLADADAELTNSARLLFTPYEGFTITYDYGKNHHITVRHSAKKTGNAASKRGGIAVDFSKSLETLIEETRKKIAATHFAEKFKILGEKYAKAGGKDQANASQIIKKFMSDLKREIRETSENPKNKEIIAIRDEFFKELGILHTIFIPATRSFISDFDDLRLNLMNDSERLRRFSKSKSGDIALTAFSHIYRRYMRGFSLLEDKELMRGSVANVNGRAKFFINGQTLDISEVSSGQKELFPLLMLLQEIEEKEEGPVFIIIEEPEAHLFPKDQILILDRIAEFANKTNSKVFITTHSPYILMELNNLLEANARQYAPMKEKSVNADEATVWMLGDKNKSILNKDSKLVGLNYIEEIEVAIFNEFQEIMRSMRKSG